MKIKVTIDITTPEGRQIVEELKQFPDIVNFDDDVSIKNLPIVNDYMESEVFWKLVESKRRKFCTDNGII